MKRTTALATCALVALLVAASTTAAQTTIPVTLEEDHIALEAPAAEMTAPVAALDVPVPAPVEAAPVPVGPEDEWTGGDTAKYILTPLLEPVAYLLTGLIGVFLLFLTLFIKQRFGVEVSAKHLAMLNELADAGVNLAEERSREAMKTGGTPPSSVEKGKQAVDFAVGMAKQMGLSDKLLTYLEDLVKARVGKARSGDESISVAVGTLKQVGHAGEEG